MSEAGDDETAITETLGVVSLGAMTWKWIRRRSLLQWGLLSLVGLFMTTALGAPGLVMLAALFLVVGSAVIGAGVRTPPPHRTVRASLRGLRIEGRRPIDGRRLRSASIAKVPDGYQIDVTRRLGLPIRMLTPTAVQARRVVDALGLGLDRQVFQTRVLSPLVGLTALVVGCSVVLSAFAALAFTQLTSGFSVLIWFCAMLTVVVLSNTSTRLRIGRDAIETRWLWRRRSHRITELLRLEVMPRTWVHPHRVRVHRKNGVPFELPISQRPRAHPAGFEEVSRVVERIEAAMHAAGRATDARFGEWNRSRAVLAPEDWLSALRLGDREYREAAMPFDPSTLLEVLDDVHAPLEDRAAAAVALGARADVALNIRLLERTRSTALPELVKVIEAVRAGDDAALHRALKRVPRARVEVPAQAKEAHTNIEDAIDADQIAPSARARLLP